MGTRGVDEPHEGPHRMDWVISVITETEQRRPYADVVEIWVKATATIGCSISGCDHTEDRPGHWEKQS